MAEEDTTGIPGLDPVPGNATQPNLARSNSDSDQDKTAATRPSVTDNLIPEVLSPGDAALYREIFALQKSGKWQSADKRIAKLADRRLMGHVLAQRYMHPTAYRSKYTELKAWLDKFADHPDAARIYALAVKRRPANYKWPRKPVAHRSIYAGPAEPTDRLVYKTTKRLGRSDRVRAYRLKAQIRRNVNRTRLSVSEEALRSKTARRLLDQVEIDDQLSEVAAGWYYYGRSDKAYKIAGPAARRSGDKAPITAWIAGLSAWRLGRLEDAAEHFEQLAQSPYASPWNATSGAYWAARAHLRLRRPQEMSRWLSLAAQSPRTFYGLLARRALGIETRFDFKPHQVSAGGTRALLNTPESSRALALIQVGQRRLAERELLRLRNWTKPEGVEALLAVAEQAKLPSLSFKLASRLVDNSRGGLPDGALEAALYPIPPWQPNGGFKVDRALVYALMRQESAFNPNAKSGDGARGLMQLMPATAGFMARRRFSGSRRNQLFDPGLNLDLGQRYIAHLLSNNVVQGNLFRLATAYNGGPGNLAKWQRKMDYKDDPLLFIESLPSRETRLFIERVLTNLWIYRARLGQPAPSLDATVAGDWPSYAALDAGRQNVAQAQPRR